MSAPLNKADAATAPPSAAAVVTSNEATSEPAEFLSSALAATNLTGEEEIKSDAHITIGDATSADCSSKATSADALSSPAASPPKAVCHQCGEESVLCCSRCKSTLYCSKVCQKADWPTHKLDCGQSDLNSTGVSESDLLATSSGSTPASGPLRSDGHPVDYSFYDRDTGELIARVPLTDWTQLNKLRKAISEVQKKPPAGGDTPEAEEAAPVRFIQATELKEDATSPALALVAASMSAPVALVASGLNALATACHRCLKVGGSACSKCLRTFYCSHACQQADWRTHKLVCDKEERMFVQPPADAPSIRESKLPQALLGCAFSFLSFFQAGEAACVNHAWRNASLLPSAAPHSQLHITGSGDSKWAYMSAHARHNLLSLDWGDERQSCLQYAAAHVDPPPVFPRLRELFAQMSSGSAHEAKHQAPAMKGWFQSMAPNLQSVMIHALTISGPDPALPEVFLQMPKLRHLALVGSTLFSSFIDVLPRLLETLESLYVPSAICDVRAKLLVYGGRQPTLQEREWLALASTHMERMIALLAAKNAPVFSRLTQLVLDHVALKAPASENDLSFFAHLSDHFPSLEELELQFLHADEDTQQRPATQAAAELKWRRELLGALKQGLQKLLTRSLRTLRVAPRGSGLAGGAGRSAGPPTQWERKDIDNLLPVEAPHLRTLQIRTCFNEAIEPHLTRNALKLLAERAPNLEFVGVQVSPSSTAHVHELTSRLGRLEQLTVRQHAVATQKELKQLYKEELKRPRLATAQAHLPVCHLLMNTAHVALPVFRYLPPSIGQLCFTLGVVSTAALFEYAQYFPIAFRESPHRPRSVSFPKFPPDRVDAVSVEPSFFEAHGVVAVKLDTSEWSKEYRSAVQAAKVAAEALEKERAGSSSGSSPSPLLPRGIPHSLYFIQCVFDLPFPQTWDAASMGRLRNCVGVYRDRVYMMPPSTPDYTAVKRKLLARFEDVERDARRRLFDDPFAEQLQVAIRMSGASVRS